MNPVVFDIQRYCLHDGPGIRTVVFFKGCPLSCKWCCNPESQKYEPELFYAAKRCIVCKTCEFACPVSAIEFTGDKLLRDKSLCNDCFRCADVCPSKALSVKGEELSVNRIVEICLKDAVFYKEGGGITISGGEPLAQPEALFALLSAAKVQKLSAAIETCGFADYAVLKEAAKYLDYILYDIKSLNSERHKKFTGVPCEMIIDNFERLSVDFPYLKKCVRTPVIPGFNENEPPAIEAFLKDKPGTAYELLKHHNLGSWKYAALGVSSGKTVLPLC